MTTFTLSNLNNSLADSAITITGTAGATGRALLIIATERSGAGQGSVSISDSAGTWTKVHSLDNELGDGTARISGSLWWRESVSADTTSISATVNGMGAARQAVSLLEITPSAAYTWTFQDEAIAGSGTADLLNGSGGTSSGSTGTVSGSDLFVVAWATVKERGNGSTTGMAVSPQTTGAGKYDGAANEFDICWGIEGSGQSGGTFSTTADGSAGAAGETGVVGVAVFSGGASVTSIALRRPRMVPFRR